MTRLVAFTVAVALVAFFCWVLYVCIDRSELVEPTRVVTEQKFPTSWPSTTSTSQPSHVQVITSVPRARTHPTAPSERSLAAIRECESGGDYGAVSRSGKFRGAYQFDQQTWEANGGHGDPAAASPAEQDRVAARLHARRGSAPWPICGRAS